MKLSSSHTPHEIVQSMVVGRAGLQKKELIAILQDGSEKLIAMCQKPRSEKGALESSLAEEEEYYNLPIDVKHKLIDLRKLKSDSFKNKDQKGAKIRTQFVAYCRMLSEGIALKEGLTPLVVESIVNELAQYIEFMQKLELDPQPAVTLDEKEKGKTMKLEISSLREIMESYLDELTVDPGEEAWEELDVNPDYERLIAFRQKTIFRIFSDYFPVVFMLFEAPLEQRFYVIWLEMCDSTMNLVVYDTASAALSHIMEFINENDDYSIEPPVTDFSIEYTIGEQITHNVAYYNDNRITLAQKFELILQ